MSIEKDQTIKVGLLIDEFFGGAGTAFGGYGYLARRYIAKYIPNKSISIDVLLGRNQRNPKTGSIYRSTFGAFFATKWYVDDVCLYRLPWIPFFSKLWLKRKNYSIYLSIELTLDWVMRNEPSKDKKLILWIQDPRPWSEWEKIIRMTYVKEPCYYNQRIYNLVNKLHSENRVKFVSQGVTLNNLAKKLYMLPQETPIQYLPNPVEVDEQYIFDIKKKKKQILFLGRLEPPKRAWLFCEVAKKLPEYEFFILGQFFRNSEENKKALAQYMDGNIRNLHFMGHDDGEMKNNLLKESRLLLSTSIWEAIPISWLEALSYGTLIVSDLEREGLAENFGKFVGEITGDGFDQIEKFIPAIKYLMENDREYEKKAKSAIKYIRSNHNIERFVADLRNVITETANEA
ncbi:MAG: glycosyltransferase family 4 protein [Oscillospiraceae bacterium]|nr:glycosyltransferase family 4 protein [Oscillospiraceae bacterium]